ncbi:hypothetical protein J4458_00040 [Candidatus Woesearchaeota archaeon]|nr:hypothetical protein [Candidatus Woesearchaeota archaeon]
MHGQMPQEIEVWYIIPALRRELTKTMIDDFGLTQKQVAKNMSLTEAAVSQYLNSKRAKEVIFTEAVLKEIKRSAERIIEDSRMLVPEMLRLCKLTAVRHIMCDLHKKQDIELPDDCNVCHEEELVNVK